MLTSILEYSCRRVINYLPNRFDLKFEWRRGGHVKLHNAKRLIGVASALALAGVVPLVSASPASANQSTCVNYLGNRGYDVGPKVRAACAHPALQSPLGAVPSFDCTHGLRLIGVKDQHAVDACRRA
jgi:hypothetical protein